MMRLNITEHGSIALDPGLIHPANFPCLVNRIQTLLKEKSLHDDGLVSIGLVIPELPFPVLTETEQRMFWTRPADDQWWLGLGCAWRADSSVNDHLSVVSRLASKMWTNLDTSECAFPVRLGVWSEKKFSRLILPAVQFSRSNAGTSVTVTPDPQNPNAWIDVLAQGMASFHAKQIPSTESALSLESQSEPDISVWLAAAERAIADIRDGVMEKLVLSRKVEYRGSRPVSANALIDSLCQRYSNCTVFASDVDDDCWIGASPEKLLDCQDGQVFSEAVAGTIRCEDNEFVNRQLGEWLLHDPKTRHEHSLVVEGLREKLKPFCLNVEVGQVPGLLRLRGLQHLYMPINGELKRDTQSLEVAQRMHPSAAVCGWPQEIAAKWLEQHEPLERRGYSGLVGWVDSQNNAALNVVLRSYRINGKDVDLYAGAGLVEDSDPQAEWDETELKLANMIEALRDA